MEKTFLNIIQWINDNRLWLGPLLLICVSVITIKEIKKAITDVQR